MASARTSSPSGRTAKKCAELSRILIREEIKCQKKQITAILKKPAHLRNQEEQAILQVSCDMVNNINKNKEKRQLAKDRVEEVEDPPDLLEQKCDQLCSIIKASKRLIIYSGAGISTAASIPDYRGPNGVWTLLQQGMDVQTQDLSEAEPTLTHMAIYHLFKEGYVKHVVSQNCDGLHLRSGLPREALSEVHGNMYIEVCKKCEPQKEYIRLFDVTEKTGVRRHGTGRYCLACRAQLTDTIVHFGEKGTFVSPYNWKEAAKAADEADVVLCLGSSLKVLRKYPCLWNMHKIPAKRPKLCIVNLQWTPKDKNALLKINFKCDKVMELLAHRLGINISKYDKLSDPIFDLATPLQGCELDTTSRKLLQKPSTSVAEFQLAECKREDHKPDTKSTIASHDYMDVIHPTATLVSGDSKCEISNVHSSIAIDHNYLKYEQTHFRDKMEIEAKSQGNKTVNPSDGGVKEECETKANVSLETGGSEMNINSPTKNPGYSPPTPTQLRPGWFGKGLAIKKRRKSVLS